MNVPNRNDCLWMAVGAALVIVVTLVVLHFQKSLNPIAVAEEKAQRVELVEHMRLVLTSASEGEKSAVLAITEQESKTFADEARTATAEVERMRKQLADLLKVVDSANERDSFAQFSEAFAEFQRIDKDLLELAVRSTNLKAYALAYGPASETLKEMNVALSHLIVSTEDLPESKTIMLLAFGAQTAALRIHALIPQHIAEESESKEDAMEKLISADDKEIRNGFDRLAIMSSTHNSADLKTAVERYASYSKIRSQIIALSRENTNVRSLAISLNEKRKVTILCQAALSALLEAIREDVPAAVVLPRPR